MHKYYKYTLAGLILVLIALLTPRDYFLIENKISKYIGQKHRPYVHFSPESNWMNDPNGMVYYEGEYHLFFQYHPDSTVWGPMHWGHAVSEDLLHWEELPIALYPGDLGYIFSGSAVIDWNNTSGLQEGNHPPMVAIFTHHNPEGEKELDNNVFQYQSIAYSSDKGRTWTKYQGNPVIPNPGIRDFRDPKVFWHEEAQRWVLILAAADKVMLYSSPNLIDWELQSDFGADIGAHGGVWECPDLFKLPVEDGNEEKWVMLVSIGSGGPNGGSATQYFVGDFDGTSFTPSQKGTQWLDYGRDNYAGVTWSDIPKEDDRRLFMGWMSNWDYAQVVPTEAWRSAMTLPRTLHLSKMANQYRVESRPIDELNSIESEQVLVAQDLSVENNMDDSVTYELIQRQKEAFSFEILQRVQVVFDLKDIEGKSFGIELSNQLGEKYYLKIKDGLVESDRRKVGDNSFSEKFAKSTHKAIIPDFDQKEALKVEMIVDVSSVEIFIEDGELVFTELIFPSEHLTYGKIFSQNGEVKINSKRTTRLIGTW